MCPIDEHVSIADAYVRRQAVTTFDRNVVVIAGAGTGKTTLLVNRLIHTLMREPQPAAITQVVALTFTNKAAMEMKVRLRERLRALLAPDSSDDSYEGPETARLAELRERYGLSTDTIMARAEAALHDLERAQIGTVHSFAAHLLRLYPIESGVDPDFEEDEGLRFEEHFAALWETWLDGELGAMGTDHARWHRLLSKLELRRVRELAYELCSELVPLEEVVRQVEDRSLFPPLREWFSVKQIRTAELLSTYARPKRRKIETQLAGAQELFLALMGQGLYGIRQLDPQVREALAEDMGSLPAGWNGGDFEEAEQVIQIARQVLAVDQDLLEDLFALLPSLVQRVRTTFLGSGWISFDGLLARARALLRDHPMIRERLKHEYQAILVDEFQDTDPTQYEIILYMSERHGRCHTSWRELELDPGKLFIVGDPKQSIYAFRRADIEAFDQVVKKILASGGAVYELVTNFRSHDQVLGAINALFDRLFHQQENIQPPNVPLLVRPGRREGVTKPGVEIRLITANTKPEALDAAAATRLEAEALAAFLERELIGQEVLTDSHGRSSPLRPGHVALLFRKLTQAQEYLEALRRHEIPYVTDGEKHFYRRQEVVDVVNLMRVVDNPHDTIALVGVLRSPIGGLTDQELVELREREALDYFHPDRLSGWTSRRAHTVRRLYGLLADLSREAHRCSLPEAVDLLFQRLPILELAAASFHGEQAVANLIKIRNMAADLANRPFLTFTGFVELMTARLVEQPEEAESTLAEESLEAVRVLTIHKAKGLEFPMVVLPGLHHGVQVGRVERLVSHDWSTGIFGLSVGGHCSLGTVLVNEKYRLREEAERRRVFYVGTTRAKERLILSGGLPDRGVSRGTFLALLSEAAGQKLGKREDRGISIGAISLEQTVIAARDRIPRRPRRPKPAKLVHTQTASALAQLWNERDRVWLATSSMPRHLTPSSLREQEGRPSEEWKGGEPERARLIGSLAHRVLELWDFQRDPGELDRHMQTIVNKAFPTEWAQDAEALLIELRELLREFVASSPYEELRRATILGREIPFTIPWPVDGPSPVSTIMEGVIDVLYRLDGRIWIADYKTDRGSDVALADLATHYQRQAHVYREAVTRCLALDQVGFKFIFLRNGTAVTG